MASFSEVSARVAFKLDTGETKNEKPVYRTVALSNIDGSVTAEDLGDVAGRLKNFLQFPTDSITLSRTDLLSL
ncbi:MAG: DUF1659 domain-containing protein [Synergistaceae bacterium]|jgi:hypothetical protein|nr:DUF1659 domain-containing protein [Synergistaceae bacterium]